MKYVVYIDGLWTPSDSVRVFEREFNDPKEAGEFIAEICVGLTCSGEISIRSEEVAA